MVIAPPDFSLLFIVACFWLVYLVVSRLLVKPLGEMLEERRRRAVGARENLDEAQLTLKDALARCERELASAGLDAGKQRQGLREEGENVRAARLASAREQGQLMLTALAAELDAAAQTARASMRAQAGVLARELADRLGGRVGTR